MDKFNHLYDQFALYKEKANRNDTDFTTNLLQYGIKENYFLKVNKAIELLVDFYDAKLADSSIRSAVSYKLNQCRKDDVKFCLLIDMLRCYDGLSHPTTFATSEGIALLVLLDKIIGERKIMAYDQLGAVSPDTLSLIDLVPCLSECSEQLGSKYSLYLPTVFEKEEADMERLYRRILYNLCKTIAEVGGEISTAEKEWLNEIALLNDDASSNDIDISNF